MEPNVATLALHPAILIASGYECITSTQVRFLNAYRKHFHDNKQDIDQSFTLSLDDFALGGVLNPYGSYLDIQEAHNRAVDKMSSYPYVTRRDIITAYYQDGLNTIWSDLLVELFNDLSDISIHMHSQSYNYTKQVIHQLYRYPIYQKIASLHLCGLGAKLIHAFDYVFAFYHSYEKKLYSQVKNK